MFFLPPFFVKEFPRFGRRISAKIGKSRLKSAKSQPKFGKKSTKSQLKSTKWALLISHWRWWERTPNTQTFWSGYLPVGWSRCGGPKSSICLRNPGKPNFLAGYPGIFAGISRGLPKSLRNKSLCSIFWSLKNTVFQNDHLGNPDNGWSILIFSAPLKHSIVRLLTGGC